MSVWYLPLRERGDECAWVWECVFLAWERGGSVKVWLENPSNFVPHRAATQAPEGENSRAGTKGRYDWCEETEPLAETFLLGSQQPAAGRQAGRKPRGAPGALFAGVAGAAACGATGTGNHRAQCRCRGAQAQRPGGAGAVAESPALQGAVENS